MWIVSTHLRLKEVDNHWSSQVLLTHGCFARDTPANLGRSVDRGALGAPQVMKSHKNYEISLEVSV